MSGAKGFGAVLSAIRREQGFKSAHAFFKSREGRRHLGFTFANYLNIERGRTLPKSGRLKGLIRALGLPEQSPQARRLVRAYLASVLGSEELLDFAGAVPEAEAASDPRRLAEDAARQALSQRTVQLSMEQWRTLAGNVDGYACHTFLVNSPGWVGIAELGKLTGLKAAALRRALKTLAAAKVVEVSGGRARSPFAGRHLKPPLPLLATTGLSSALYKHREAWIAGRAKLAGLAWLTVRMEKNNVERYLQQLTESVNLSAVYGDVERSPETAVYLVEGRIYGLFP